MACVEANRKAIDRSIAEREEDRRRAAGGFIHPADHREVSDEGVGRLTRRLTSPNSVETWRPQPAAAAQQTKTEHDQ